MEGAPVNGKNKLQKRIWAARGSLKRGETAAQALVRELQEELGIKVKDSWLKKPWKLKERRAEGTTQ